VIGVTMAHEDESARPDAAGAGLVLPLIAFVRAKDAG
jgi:hypothetical protein